MKRAVCIVVLFLLPVLSMKAYGEKPLDIGSRRELFVDGHLIESQQRAWRQLHHPTPRNIAIVHDAPWEGAGSGYHSVIQDGDLYRLYYRGSKLGVENGQLKVGPEVYCYAESRDGVTFTKPQLGLHEHSSSKRNNIIWTGVGSHNFAPFLDTRAGCPAESRFKALGGSAAEGGLFALHSADGDIRVELQDADGKPLPGFTLEQCAPIFGDTLDRTVTWKGGSGVGELVGKPVRLRFVLRDADLYSLKFEETDR